MKHLAINTVVMIVVMCVGCVVLMLRLINWMTGGRLCRKLYDTF